MNRFEVIMDEMDTADFAVIEYGLKSFDDINKNIASFFGKVNALIEQYQTTGVVPPTTSIERWDAVPEVTPGPSKSAEDHTSAKENIEPKPSTSVKQEVSTRRSRPKRNAFKEASQSIAHQSSLSANAKLRRPSNVQETFQNVYVKMEKLSMCNNEVSDAGEVPTDVRIKTEVEQAMPAPTRPAPRRKNQKNSKVQVKQEKIDEEQRRDSDVIIADPTVTTINLVESSDEGDVTIKNADAKNEEKTRNTRTKTAKKKTKRSRTQSSEDERTREKRSKSNEDNEEETTHFEDAVSTMDDKNDATFVAKPGDHKEEVPQPALNATIVVENPKVAMNLMPKSVEDMMTDDESEEEVPKKPVKPIRAIPKPTKQVFSPFEQSPVKKKVQAFEKLKEEANSLPQRVTRTKTKAKAKEQADAEVAATEAEPEPSSNVKEKAKIFTPQASKFLPKAASTTVKPGRSAPSTSNESLVSNKSLSALKASQAEYREREKKRREKEQEALKKREALMQAQIEEKKRKREEKQLKAQQQREALEREKMKILEAQKLKDERHKQLLAEQEERKMKQREEMEKKRMMAKMRALEEKKREEEKNREEQRRIDANEDRRPLYMRYRAPLLPTDDCYDSDDENYKPERVKLPDFTKEAKVRFMQKCAFAAGEAVKNTFFCIQAQTPDLQEIFEVIKPEKLKRTSSAVWHKPPRFTMVPGLELHDETAEFEDD